MADLYPQVRMLHIALAVASGLLFAIRGVLVLNRRAASANHGFVRYFSYAIDTNLLAAALLLLAILRLSPLSTPWLAFKIALLPVYIVLGSFALRRSRTRRAQVACLAAALFTYLLIFGIARAHDPAGWWRLL